MPQQNQQYKPRKQLPGGGAVGDSPIALGGTQSPGGGVVGDAPKPFGTRGQYDGGRYGAPGGSQGGYGGSNPPPSGPPSGEWERKAAPLIGPNPPQPGGSGQYQQQGMYSAAAPGMQSLAGTQSPGGGVVGASPTALPPTTQYDMNQPGIEGSTFSGIDPMTGKQYHKGIEYKEPTDPWAGQFGQGFGEDPWAGQFGQDLPPMGGGADAPGVEGTEPTPTSDQNPTPEAPWGYSESGQYNLPFSTYGFGNLQSMYGQWQPMFGGQAANKMMSSFAPIDPLTGKPYTMGEEGNWMMDGTAADMGALQDARWANPKATMGGHKVGEEWYDPYGHGAAQDNWGGGWGYNADTGWQGTKAPTPAPAAPDPSSYNPYGSYGGGGYSGMYPSRSSRFFGGGGGGGMGGYGGLGGSLPSMNSGYGYGGGFGGMGTYGGYGNRYARPYVGGY